jgi:hypothetical protein
MEVKYRTGEFEVLFDVKDETALFEAIASFQETFVDNTVTINRVPVSKDDIQFRVREVDGNKYFEKVYVGSNGDLWGFKQRFGQNKKGGGIFPKRYLDDEDKAKYQDGGNGWFKWKKENSSNAPQQESTAKGGEQKAPF